MSHIPTTATRVEKFKRQAKARAKTSGLPLHEAQNVIAVEAGYLHWKHMAVCAKATMAGPAAATPSTSLSLMDEFGHLLSDEDMAELDAVPESDRTFWLRHIIMRYPEGAARFRTLGVTLSMPWSDSHTLPHS